MIALLKKISILSECQYGFRNSRSTYMALVDLIENICESIDKKKYVMGIFIDLKKAFDTIVYDILLNKLYHYCIRGISKDWIKSYLEIENNLCNMMMQYQIVKKYCAACLRDQF